MLYLPFLLTVSFWHKERACIIPNGMGEQTVADPGIFLRVGDDLRNLRPPTAG